MTTLSMHQVDGIAYRIQEGELASVDNDTVLKLCRMVHDMNKERALALGEVDRMKLKCREAEATMQHARHIEATFTAKRAAYLEIIENITAKNKEAEARNDVAGLRRQIRILGDKLRAKDRRFSEFSFRL